MDERYDIAPKRETILPLGEVRWARVPTRYRTFASQPPALSAWHSEANPFAILDLAVDPTFGNLWLATWGGVLEWSYPNEVVHHTSAHGLIGNPTRCIAVDQSGIMWAGSQEQGLATLDPASTEGWQIHPGCSQWRVTRLAPRPSGGVVAALQTTNGQTLLAVLAGRADAPQLHLRNHLATRAPLAMWVASDGTIWLGNTWGLFEYQEDTADLVEWTQQRGVAVSALAAAPDNALWVGTLQGLYRLRASRLEQVPHGPQEEVVAMAADPESDTLWVATPQRIGKVHDDSWEPVMDAASLVGRNPRGPGWGQAASAGIVIPTSAVPYSILAGGHGGLFGVSSAGSATPLLHPTSECPNSHVIHALNFVAGELWAATARGLFRRRDTGWESCLLDEQEQNTFTGLQPEADNRQVWAASLQGGIHLLRQGAAIGFPYLGPIVALTGTPEGDVLWAATTDTIYERRRAGTQAWLPLRQRIADHLGSALIQTLHVSLEQSRGSHPSLTLWVGTTEGLFSYSLDRDVWSFPDALGVAQPVHSMATDSVTDTVWVGTSAGVGNLTSGERLGGPWDVRALVIGPRADGPLWVGTTQGLKRWPRIGASFDPTSSLYFQTINSGLATNRVTALVLEPIGERSRLWVGSTAGVSCYEDE